MMTRLIRFTAMAAALATFFATPLSAQRYQERQMGGVGITIFRDEYYRG
jgi:hypothetical protein